MKLAEGKGFQPLLAVNEAIAFETSTLADSVNLPHTNPTHL